jgi:uncharacterized membrane protein
MLLFLLSFNYTPPPDEVISIGNVAIAVLMASLLLVRNVKLGALMGGLIAAGISCWVESHTGGDMAMIEMITRPPVYGVVGALVGAFISHVSKFIWQAVHRQPDADGTPEESR